MDKDNDYRDLSQMPHDMPDFQGFPVKEVLLFLAVAAALLLVWWIV